MNKTSIVASIIAPSCATLEATLGYPVGWTIVNLLPPSYSSMHKGVFVVFILTTLFLAALLLGVHLKALQLIHRCRQPLQPSSDGSLIKDCMKANHEEIGGFFEEVRKPTFSPSDFHKLPQQKIDYEYICKKLHEAIWNDVKKKKQNSKNEDEICVFVYLSDKVDKPKEESDKLLLKSSVYPADISTSMDLLDFNSNFKETALALVHDDGKSLCVRDYSESTQGLPVIRNGSKKDASLPKHVIYQPLRINETPSKRDSYDVWGILIIEFYDEVCFNDNDIMDSYLSSSIAIYRLFLEYQLYRIRFFALMRERFFLSSF